MPVTITSKTAGHPDCQIPHVNYQDFLKDCEAFVQNKRNQNEFYEISIRTNMDGIIRRINEWDISHRYYDSTKYCIMNEGIQTNAAIQKANYEYYDDIEQIDNTPQRVYHILMHITLKNDGSIFETKPVPLSYGVLTEMNEPCIICEGKAFYDVADCWADGPNLEHEEEDDDVPYNYYNEIENALYEHAGQVAESLYSIGSLDNLKHIIDILKKEGFVMINEPDLNEASAEMNAILKELNSAQPQA